MRNLPITGRLARAGTFTDWVQRYLDVSPADLVGCTETELEVVARAAGGPLPAAYRQLLLEGGKAVGSGRVADYFSRCFLLYPRLLEVRDVALDVIREARADERLLDRAFPFYNWEVYRLGLLDLAAASDDPPVLLLDEDTGRQSPGTESLSVFIGWEIFKLGNALDRLGKQ